MSRSLIAITIFFRFLLLAQVITLIILIARVDLLQRISFRFDLLIFFLILMTSILGTLFPRGMHALFMRSFIWTRQYWKFLIFLVIFTFVIFEIMVRVMFGNDIFTYRQAIEFDRYVINGQVSSFEDIYQSSDIYAYQLKPNIEAKIVDHLYNIEYRLLTNEDGFRAIEEIVSSSPEGNIMILGDSVTLGVGVNQGEPYADNLQRRWQDRYIVYNFGVSGWGFAEYYLTYQNYFDRLKPSLIIVGVYPTNDFVDLSNSNWPGRGKGDLPQVPLKRRDLYMDPEGHLRVNNLRHRIPLLRNSAGFIFIMQYFVEPTLNRVVTLFKLYYEPLTNVDFSLQIIANMAQRAPVLVLILPSQADYPEPKFLPPNYILELQSFNNVYVLDLHSIVGQDDAKAYVDGFHFTAEMHKRIAEAIFEFINEQQLLQKR